MKCSNPYSNCADLVGVCTRGRNNMAQKLYFRLKKNHTSLVLAWDLWLCRCLNTNSKRYRCCLNVDKKKHRIIHIQEEGMETLVPKYSVHQLLKMTRCVAWHFLKQAKWRAKSSLSLILLSNWQLVIATCKVERGKKRRICKGIQRLFDSWQWEGIFLLVFLFSCL